MNVISYLENMFWVFSYLSSLEKGRTIGAGWIRAVV